jgi:hypothetical protein
MSKRPLVPFEKISAGGSAVANKSQPDSTDKAEERALEETRRFAEVDALHQANLDRAENRKMRSEYAGKVFWYLCAYTVGSAMLTVMTGFGCFGFELSEIVLATIVGSTAVAAIGLVGFVVSGLFKFSN